jgi:MFS family permease
MEFQQKHLKFNYALQLTEASFWGLGFGLASTTSVIPLFLAQYTDSAILFSLIPAIQTIGFQLPQLFMAKRIASQHYILPIVTKMTLNERLPYLGMAMIALFANRLPPAAVISLLFLMIVWQGVGGGITGNAWQNLVSKVIPSDIRSMFFSIQGAGVNLLTSVGAFLAGMLLEKNSSNTGYALSFFLGFIAMMTSYTLLHLTREAPSEEVISKEDSPSILEAAKDILVNDKDFRSFVFVRVLLPFATMASSLFTIYIIKQFNASERTVGAMTSLLFISTVIAGLLLGWISDHIGRKFAMLLTLGIMAVTAFLAMSAQTIELFYVVFILTGVINGSFWSVFLSFSLEFGTTKTRPTYVGLINTLIAPSTLIAQLLGGSLADSISYQSTFLVTGIFAVLTLLLTFFFVRITNKKRRLSSA